ncbi:MAG: hypothetical protein JNM93_02245 [Bacteriovoracaceae bacterium]|nr:hypothetical protein [Bacteriovoracaceae bacterium]
MKHKYLFLLILFVGCLKPSENNSPIKASIKMPLVIKRLEEFKKNETQPIVKASAYDKLSSDDKYNYEILFVQEIALVTRRIEPSNEEIHNWLNALLQGATREGVYRGLVHDQYYYRIEGEPSAITNESLQFTKNFMSQFLFQQFNDELLKDVNIFTLKRIVCEKTLDVIDALRANPEELYAWYALFSEHVAKENAAALNNKIRKIADANVHLEWARSVPEQHLKTEVLTKLHMIFNNLNKI